MVSEEGDHVSVLLRLVRVLESGVDLVFVSLVLVEYKRRGIQRPAHALSHATASPSLEASRRSSLLRVGN